MHKSTVLPLGLAALFLCLCFNHAGLAQAVGNDTFESSSQLPSAPYCPDSAYAPHIRYPGNWYRRWEPGDYPTSADRPTEPGQFQIEPDGSVTFIPDDPEDRGDAFTGFEDIAPPAKTKEWFCSRENNNNDEFSKSDYPYPVSRGFSKESRRWPTSRMPLRVYVSETIERSRNGFVKAEINQCLHDWCTAVHGRITYVLTPDFKNADIYFMQRDTLNHEWADNDRSYSKKGLDEVRVSLLEQTVSYLPERRLRAVLLHESGHALGLIDHLPDSTDAMSVSVCDITRPVTQLSANDRIEIRKLYASYEPIKQATLLEQSYQTLSQSDDEGQRHAFARR